MQRNPAQSWANSNDRPGFQSPDRRATNLRRVSRQQPNHSILSPMGTVDGIAASVRSISDNWGHIIFLGILLALIFGGMFQVATTFFDDPALFSATNL